MWFGAGESLFDPNTPELAKRKIKSERRSVHAKTLALLFRLYNEQKSLLARHPGRQKNLGPEHHKFD